jgi:hypothetical protein
MLTARTGALDCVEAAEAERGPLYTCRVCGEAVILRKGDIRIAHFAHRPDAACAWSAGMSPEHLEAQRRLADALRARGVCAQLEVIAPSLAGDRRIDVLAWPPDRPAARVALEVQASDLTVGLVAARSSSYEAENVAPLWLRLLDFSDFQKVQTLPGRGTVWIERWRARAWERWVCDQLGGRVWFIDAGTFLAWRAAFVPAETYDEASRSWRELTAQVDVELEGPFGLSELRLNRGRVKGKDGRRRLAAWFAGPGEPAAAPSGAPVRAVARRGELGDDRELQARIGGRWTPVVTDGARSDWRTRRSEPAALASIVAS